MTLAQYRLNPHDRIGIELRINYYQEQPVSSYVMPDVLGIQVKDKTGNLKVVQVIFHYRKLRKH
jgi:hypothetical protein